MTTDRIAEIRARAEAATEGPWFHNGIALYEMHDDPDDGVLRRFSVPTIWTHQDEITGPANGAFIAHARSDVPWLLAENDRLQAAIDAVLAYLKRICDENPSDIGAHMLAGNVEQIVTEALGVTG